MEPADATTDEPMCRICFSGQDPALGRLFAPCLCKGTQRHVHTTCLSQWRRTSNTAFYGCNQCLYQYRTARANISGLASNPYALAGATFVAFLLLTFLAGFCASTLLWFLNFLPSEPLFESFFWWFGSTSPFASPWDYGDAIGGVAEKAMSTFTPAGTKATPTERLLQYVGMAGPDARESWTFKALSHFALGWSLIGIVSFLHMAFTYSFIGGIHHLRLFRRTGQQQQGRRPNERDRGMDFAALLAIVFVLIGTVKAVRSLYRFIQRQSFKMLSRVEDTILEVNA